MAKTVRTLTTAELLNLPVSVDLETAGRAYGIGRTTSHELARAGQFPCTVLRVGSQYRVPKAELLRSLGVQSAVEASEPVLTAS